MKKLTITYQDDAKLDLNPIIAVAESFVIETVDMNGTESPARTKKVISGETTQRAIMKHYTAGGTFSRRHATEWMGKAGYSETSTPAALSMLSRNGYIERLNGDRYKFTKPFGADQKSATEASA